MNKELKQKIEKVMSEWEESASEYNLPNDTLMDITDFYTISYNMAKIIKELTEREAKLIACLNEVKTGLGIYYDAHGKLMFDKIETTLSELGE